MLFFFVKDKHTSRVDIQILLHMVAIKIQLWNWLRIKMIVFMLSINTLHSFFLPLLRLIFTIASTLVVPWSWRHPVVRVPIYNEQTCLHWPAVRNKHACKKWWLFVSAICIFKIWWAMGLCRVGPCFLRSAHDNFKLNTLMAILRRQPKTNGFAQNYSFLEVSHKKITSSVFKSH